VHEVVGAEYLEFGWDAIRAETLTLLETHAGRERPYSNASLVSKRGSWRTISLLFEPARERGVRAG
jgi:hypothetical protein